MIQRTARCHCGRLELLCLGDPIKISMCHCCECQQRTGSVFSIAAFFDRENVRVGYGSSKAYQRDSASGFPVTFHFCENCGSNVYWEPARLPHLIGVAVGAFGDPCFPPPEQSVWTKDKHAWLGLPDGVRQFELSPAKRLPES